MKVPPRYLAFDLHAWPFEVDCDADGHARLPRLGPYPPFGYLPLKLFDVGNGDACGFYWPIGRELEEPLICDMHHDAWYLEPEALTLEGLARLRVFQGWDADDDDLCLLANSLHVELPAPPPEALPLHEVPLGIVADSPAVWEAHAEAALDRGDLLEAERFARESLRLFPEFTRARFLLVKVLRRGRRMQEAAREMIETFCSPVCFGGGQAECLRWLQQLPEDSDAAQPGDPVWVHRRSITLATGVKLNDDFPLYEQIIAEYLDAGMVERAVRLRHAVAERYAMETVSFRERYGYTEAEHFMRLEQDLEAAGYHQRAEALRAAVAHA